MTSRKRGETLDLLIDAFRNIKLELDDSERAYIREALDALITTTYGEKKNTETWRKMVI